MNCHCNLFSFNFQLDDNLKVRKHWWNNLMNFSIDRIFTARIHRHGNKKGCDMHINCLKESIFF